MPKSRFTEEKIIKILKESEAGAKTADLCRRHGISSNTFYLWRKKYGGMDVGDAKRLKQLVEENRRLKKQRSIRTTCGRTTLSRIARTTAERSGC